MIWLLLGIAIPVVVIAALIFWPRRRSPSQAAPSRGPLGRVLRDHNLAEAMYHVQHQDDDEERSA